MNDRKEQSTKALFGIPGLDDILLGGLRRNRLFLFEGSPGAGKTTLALQFLLEGARVGEKGLYITLSETEAELKEVALSHGWSLDGGMDIFELAPPENLLDESNSKAFYTRLTLNSERPPKEYSTRWIGQSHRGWSSTAFQKYDYSLRVLSAIADRFYR